MSDGYPPNPDPVKTTIPTTDQIIGEATSVFSSFLKNPVGAVKAAWDQKNIVMAMIVAVVLVITQLLNSVISDWGVLGFGQILTNWIRNSVLEIVLLAVLALAGFLMVHGHDESGYVGALSGVGAAAIAYTGGFVVSTVFLLVSKILPFGIIVFLSNIIRAAFGMPAYVALFILLALAIRRKTLREDEFSVARNTVLLAAFFFAVRSVIIWILW